MTILSRMWLRLLQEWWRLTVPFRLRLLGVTVDKGAMFYGMPIVSLVPGSEIRIGKLVTVCSDSRFTALGVNHPTVLRTLSPGARIEIGEETGISGGSISAAMQVRIGRQCLIGANVSITDTDFHSLKPSNRRYNNAPSDIGSAPVVIEDNVFLGAGSLVLKGVSILANSVIGAGSVVTKSVPSGVVSAGNPARLIGSLVE